MTDEIETPPPVPTGTTASSNAADEEEEPFEPSNFSIQIHNILHTAQQSHGLNNDTDYTSYRSYLTNRISRLRHSKPVYKRTGGSGGNYKKHAFRKREFTLEETNQHENFVLISVYTVERAWAHAMEIKERANEAGAEAAGKKNYHVKRLKKAAKHLEELEYFKEICDDCTKVEIDCYAAYMRGNHFCERKDWKNACKQYANAVMICNRLSAQYKSKDQLQLQQSDFFLARADNILRPLLRYCQYELQKDPNVSNEEMQEIVELATYAKDNDGDNDESKSAGDNDVNAEANANDAMASIYFRGKELIFDDNDASVRMAFIKVQNKKQILHNLKKSKGVKPNVVDSKLMDLLNSYDDAIETVEKMYQRYEGMASGPSVNNKRYECSNVLVYLKFQKLMLIMERNEKMANELRKKDVDMALDQKEESKGLGSDEDGEGGDGDAQYKLVQDIARLYDALLQDARAATDLPGSANDSDAEDVEDEFILEANANVLRIRALRCYYIGRMYAADTVGKYKEALALFQQASVLAAEAAEEIAACQDMENANVLVEEMVELEDKIIAYKCRTKACVYLASRGSGASAATSGMKLLRRLDDFDAGGKSYRLASVPFALEPIAAKPFVFDIANNYVKDMQISEIESFLNLTKPRERRGLLMRLFR